MFMLLAETDEPLILCSFLAYEAWHYFSGPIMSSLA